MSISSEALFLDAKSKDDERSVWMWLAANSLLAAAYALTGYAGLRLAFVGGAVTLFWPPSGIAFAAIWLGGLRLWPGVVLGAFLVNLTTLNTPLLAGVIAFGNVGPALAGVIAIRRIITARPDAGELRRVVWFIMVGALGSTLISATVGTLAVTLLAKVAAPIESTWIIWWMGDAMGVLIVAPPILLWRRFFASGFHWRTVADAFAFACAGCGIIAGLLLLKNPIWAVELCKLFTLLLSLWAGARFGLNGPSAITPLMAVGAVGVTMLGVGPFIRGNFYDSFALVHSYLFAEAVAGMLLAAALADRLRAIAAERQARGEAEQASANRIRLLTMISHDVRTPLSGMLGVFDALDRSDLSAEQDRLVGLGRRAGANLNKLVADILDVARIDAGRVTLDPAPFDPLQSLTDIVEIHRPAARSKGLSLDFEAQDLPARLRGDRVRFEQLVGNLVTNAVTYTLRGEVRVTAHWSRVQQILSISVADTGPGIAPADVPEMFDAFVLAPQIGNRSTGLGLGLHICRRLAELMDGRIEYAPNPTGGSLFQVSLPLAGTSGPEDARSPSPIPAARARILLVEDDPIARDVTTALLQACGHQVQTAGDAETAVQLAAAQTFDLVLMDIHLGRADVTGLDAARSIRAQADPRRPPLIIALTGEGREDQHARMQQSGLDEVWIKPISMDSDFWSVRLPRRLATLSTDPHQA